MDRKVPLTLDELYKFIRSKLGIYGAATEPAIHGQTSQSFIPLQQIRTEAPLERWGGVGSTHFYGIFSRS